MAEKDDFKLDDFEFNDYDNLDFEFDDPFSEPPEDSGRNPIDKVARATLRSTGRNLKDPTQYIRTMRKALPSNYRRAWDIADEIKGQGNELYNRALGRAAPAIKEIKRGVNAAIPSLRGKLPKKLLDKLEDLSTTYDDSSSASLESERDSHIAAILSETFVEQTKMESERWEAEKERTAFLEKSEKERHAESLLFFKSMDNKLGRIVGQYEDITYRFQRQLLEVNYRSLFALRDIILAQQESSRNLTKQMDAVIKNTGLPDAVKLRNTEAFSQLGRESLIRSFQDGFGTNISDVVSRLGKRLGDKAYNFVGGFSDVVEQIAAQSAMGGGIPLSVLAGEFGGGLVTEQLSDVAAGQMTKYRKANNLLRNSNAALGRQIANAPYALAEFANTDPNSIDPKNRRWYHATTDDYVVDAEGNYTPNTLRGKAMGGIMNMFRTLVGESLSKDGLEKTDNAASMLQPVSLNRRGLVSLTDVIPGLLSMQLRELTRLRTGTDAPLMTYNYGRGAFETSTDAKSRIEGTIRDRLDAKRSNRITTEIIDELDPEKKLSDEERQALTRQLLHNNRNRRSFDVSVLGNERNYQAIQDPAMRRRLAAFFSEQYGGVTGLGGDPTQNVRMRKATENYATLGSLIPSVLQEMELQINIGNAEVLLEMGLLKYKDNAYQFNYDAIVDFIMETKDIEDKPKEEQDGIFGKILSEAVAKTKARASGVLSGYRERFTKVMEDQRLQSLKNYVKDKSQPLVEGVQSSWNRATLSIEEHRNSGRTIKETFGLLVDNSSNAIKARYRQLSSELNKLLADADYRDVITKARIKDINDIVNSVEDKWGNIVIDAKELHNLLKSTLVEAYESEKVQGAMGSAKSQFNKVVDAYRHDPRLDAIRSGIDESKQFVDEKIQGAKDVYNTDERFEKIRQAVESGQQFKDELSDKGIKQLTSEQLEQLKDRVSGVDLEEAKRSFKDRASERWGRMRESLAAFGNEHIRSRFTRTPPSSDDIREQEQSRKQRDHIYGVIEEILAVQKEALVEQRNIIATLEAGIYVGADTEDKVERMGRFKRAVGKLWDMLRGVRALTGGIMRGAGHAAKGAGYLVGKLGVGYGKLFGAGLGLASGALGMAGRLTRNLFGLKNDIFVEGKPYPVLHHQGIKDGIYQDLTTGKIVKKLSDIKGPVKNLKTNEPAITEEDFKRGLYDTAGKPVLRNVTRKILDLYGAMLSPVTTTFRLAGNVYKSTVGKLFEMKDVYVKTDMSTPKLYGSIMKAGGYFSKRTGKVIKHYRDIDGEILDENRQVVLTLQDLRDGICDIDGKPLKTLADRILGLVGSGIGLVKNMAVGSVKAGWRALRGMFNLGKSVFNGIRKKIHINFGSIEEANYAANNETNMMLEAIYTLLDDRLPGKKTFGDVDNDGIREGSAEDILRKRAAAKEAKEEKADKTTESKSAGIWAKLTGLFSGAGKDGGEGGDEGDTYVGGSIDMGDDGTDSKEKKSKTKGGRGKFGKLGKWWNTAKNSRWLGALSRAGGAIASVGRGLLGRAVGGAALGALGGSLLGMGGIGAVVGGALSVVAGILASPWVVGAAVIGGLAYGGYKLYKYLKKADMFDYRVLQYGLVNLDDDQKSSIGLLEERMTKHVTIDGRTANLRLTKEDVMAVAEEMGIASNHVEEFLIWFTGRFKPVFLNYMAATRTLSPESTLEDIDSSKFTPEMKLRLLDMVEIPSSVTGPYSVRESPFGKEKVLYSESSIFERAEALRKEFREAVKDKQADGESTTLPEPTTTVVAGSMIGENLNQVSAEDRAKLDKQRRVNNVVMMAGGGLYGIQTFRNTGSVAVQHTASSEAIVDTKTAPKQVEVIRYKAYGLVELDVVKVTQLVKMERELYREVSYMDGKATLKLDGVTALDRFGADFGVSGKDEQQSAQWLRWFNYRFLRVFLNFCTAVHQYVDNQNPADAVGSLQPEQQLIVANAINSTKTNNVMGRSVWSISDSPWVGYKLNTDASTIRGNLLALESAVSLRKFNDNAQVFSRTVLPEVLQTPAVKPMQRGMPPMLPATPTGTGRDADNVLTRTQGRITLDDTLTSQRHFSLGVYMMPCHGRISSDYGTRVHPVTGARHDHKGIDIAAPAGTPVVAAQEGIISRREYSKSYGYVIYIDHPDGNSTRYAHLENFAQGHSVGSHVDRGETIGYVGNSGVSTGPHLHFEVRKGHGANGVPMDPLKFLSDRYSREAMTELRDNKKALMQEEKMESGDELEGVDTIASTTLNKSEKDAPTKDKVSFGINLPNMDGVSTKGGLQSMRQSAPEIDPENMGPTQSGIYDNSTSENPDMFSASSAAQRKKQEYRKQNTSEITQSLSREATAHYNEMAKIARESLGELKGINSGVKQLTELMKESIILAKDRTGARPEHVNRSGKANVVDMRKR